MSYLNQVKAEDIRNVLTHVKKERFVSACQDINDVLGLSPAYDETLSLDDQCLWLSQATQEIVESDDLALTTISTLKKLGYVVPKKVEDEDEQRTVEEQETAEVPQETEELGSDEKQDEVKEETHTEEVSAESSEPVEQETLVETPKKKRGRKPKGETSEPKVKKPREPKAPKEPKEPKPMGVIAFIRNYVIEHGKEGFTLDALHKNLCETFPERLPHQMLATCRVQLSNTRLGQKLGVTFESKHQYGDDGKSIGKLIFATPMNHPSVKAESPAEENAE